MKLNIDFETRSAVDLRRAGVYRYAADPTTDIWCMGYAFDDEPVQLITFADSNLLDWEATHWYRHPGLARIYNYVSDLGGEVHAWNAQFERVLWNAIMVSRYCAPPLPMWQTHCTAAAAAALGLPRALGPAAAALNLPIQKDNEGAKVMMKLARPRATKIHVVRYECGHERSGPTKADVSRKTCPEWVIKPHPLGATVPRACGAREAHREQREAVVWHDAEADHQRLWSYCQQDVEAERAIGRVLPPLSQSEREVYLLDQRINSRGVAVDLQLVQEAERVTRLAAEEADKDLAAITDGAVTSVRQLERLREWIGQHGVDVADLRKDTVRDLLEGDLPDKVHAAVQLRQDAGKTSTGKLQAMCEAVSIDGRLRGLLLYHGASTGRWAGRLVQPQNFPRPVIASEEIEKYITLVMEGDLANFDLPPLHVVSSLLRSMLVAGRGQRLIGGDYAQIEARVLAWLAGQDDLVELFATGGKVYEEMAASIYGGTVEDIAKDSVERQVGKGLVLGAGFQMGANKFAATVLKDAGIVLDRGEMLVCCTECKQERTVTGALVKLPRHVCAAGGGDETIEVTCRRPDMARQAIQGYRNRYPRIPDLWRGLQDAAIAAVRRPGKATAYRSIQYKVEQDILWCRLPSGRKLAYLSPRLRMRELPPPYDGEPRLALTYLGTDDKGQWVRLATYGGHLTENVVQATARDVMVAGMMRLERAGFPIILTVHDEILAEIPEGDASQDKLVQYEELMTILPEWAEGLPLAAEAWTGKRYRK